MPSASTRAFIDDSIDPPVRGFLHTPETSNNDGLILAHGAGSNAQSPLLAALAGTFCDAGCCVLRCDLPFRQSRPYGPPGPGDGARDRTGLKNAVAAMKKVAAGRIFLGGHSYGGRQASILCAEEPDIACGLLLLSYPLHPPRKPEQLRTQHFTNLRTPTLFVEGTRDPFGSIAEIEQALKLVRGNTKIVVVDGAGHDLGFKGKARAGLPIEVVAEFQELFRK
ncbi:MAG TPA: alpha/beta fold hydrolase [Candidatus Sulfotelmatobacter sp.]